MERLFNHTISVGYFTEMILGLFGNGLVNKIRHYVLATLTGLLRYHSIIGQWMRVDTVS